ncbi:MAG: GFA family protein [Candidatus Thiodiazotropha sp.]
MADIHEVTGSCLCGAVGYAISGNQGVFQYCHCSRCRKSGGGAFSANLIVAPEQFRWLRGEASVGRYELTTAKHFATGFCKICGSSLPWLTQSGRAVVVPAGSLDEDPGIRPTQNVFYASRAVWHADPASLPSFDELPRRKNRGSD